MNRHQLQIRHVTSFQPAVIEVVVAYDDVGSALRAKSVLDHIIQELGDGFRLGVRFWNFSALEASQMRAVAAAEAAEAAILWIAVSATSDLPPEVKAWIEQSARERNGQPSAIVLSQDAVTAASYPALHPYLRQIAEEAGMEFFAQNETRLQEDTAAASSQVIPTAGRRPEIPDEMWSVPRWGINEY